MPTPKLRIVPKETEQPQTPNNLAPQPSPLVGRDSELDSVCALLASPQYRIVTIGGPGGVGKTRLALGAAEALLPNFPGGVYYVDLVPLTARDRVLQAVASTLGLREEAGRPPAATLQDHISNSRMLLVLDNFEQVLPAGGTLVALLAECPGLKLLVTSREPLRVHEEHEFALQPLSLPPPGQRPTAAALLQYGAVDLFVQRANRVAPFELTGENAPDVLEICRRVDGLPLAIELVAAHTRLLSPAAILSRLRNPLPLLRATARDGGRHSTMQDAIRWSYDLLTPAEQRLFRMLSVFVGGFTLRAAEAVCNEAADVALPEDSPLAVDVLLGVESLLDKSLLYATENLAQPERRIAMLETVRHFAAGQLAASGEADHARDLHAAYYRALASLPTNGPEGLSARRAHATERENMHAALNRLLDQPPRAEPWAALEMLVRARDSWLEYTHAAELSAWLDRALQQAGPEPTALRAAGLSTASNWARIRKDYDAAARFGEESLEVARKLGDRREIALALSVLGGVALMRGDYSTAEAASEEALQIRRALNDDMGVSHTLNNLGMNAMYRGDYARAETLYAESWDASTRSGNQAAGVGALANLGFAIYYRGDYLRAARTLLDSLEVVAGTQGGRSAGRSMTGFGLALLASGQPPQPAAAERVARAVQLLGAAAEVRARGGGNLDPLIRAEHERALTAARALIGDLAFETAWAEGRALDLDAALQLAREAYSQMQPEPVQPAQSVRPARPPNTAKRLPGGLTPRELEVAALVARGCSNQEMARQLILSERTVEMHVSNALHRLGLATRAQLAAWAVEQGVAGTNNRPPR